MNISQLYCKIQDKKIIEGNLEGKCAICFKEDKNMLPFYPSEKFSLGELIYGTNLICPYCYIMFKDQSLRYSHWILTNNSFQKLKKKNVISFLLDTSPPFCLYSTKTYKRQGWLKLIPNNITISSDYLVWVYELNLLSISKKAFLKIHEKIKFLLEKGFFKKEIANGLSNYKKIQNLKEMDRFYLNWVNEHKNNQIFKWILDFI